MPDTQQETIDVGNTSNGEQIFIAGPPSMYDKAKTPLAGKVKHILMFSRDDAEWLVKALQKEIRRSKRKK